MKKIGYALVVVVVLIVGALVIVYAVSGGPTVISNRVDLNRSPEEVFNFVSDMRNELKWNPDVQYMQKVTDGPIAEGAKFRAKWHMSDTIDVRITEFQRASDVTFVNGGTVEVTLHVHLTPTGSGTALESNFVATPHGFIRAIFPIFRNAIDKQEKENMKNLKKALEQ